MKKFKTFSSHVKYYTNRRSYNRARNLGVFPSNVVSPNIVHPATDTAEHIPLPFRSAPFLYPAERRQSEHPTPPVPSPPSPRLPPPQGQNPNPSEDSAATAGGVVFFALLVGAELDGLTNLQPAGGCDDPSFPYYFKLRCESCGETSAKTTCVSLDEVVDLSSGKGTANLVQKCKFCTREGSIVMVPGQGTPLTSELSQKGEKACLMVFECRGCEPIEFDFGNGWKVESVHGTPFDIDLSEGEFDEYDDKGECPVSLSKLQSTFKVVKKQGFHGKTRYV